jgi:short subunit dehydrogenase-like uncharacterized protein
VLAVLGLVLLFTAEVADFTRFVVVAILVALGATWIELTRRRTLSEFPDAQNTTFLADTWARVSSWWEEQRSTVSARPSASVEQATDVSTRLASLADLHTNGHLTDEEYAAAKAKVLAGE